ncbi:MAG: NAD(P)H-quinone oxidoreductase [Pseudomonadales bacterium]|nr:NAD(P)H-quinone oxidoreductase [Pseudomonadales bacterium]
MRVIEVSEHGGPEVLQLAEREQPVAGQGELLIAVAAAGVNRPDIIQRMGFYPAPAGASDLLGLEVAGVVAAVGEGVEGWRVGEPVCALSNGGGYAEFTCVDAGQCLPIPSGLSAVEAASLPETFFTVWSNVFDRAKLRSGESFLVHGGTSGIGVTAIQMARAIGAKVYATAGSDEKVAACEALGAAKAINYRKEDFVEAVRAHHDKPGIDVILDMVGGDYIQKNFSLAAIEGRISNINFQAGFEASVNFMPMMTKRITFSASTLRPQSAASKARIAAALRESFWPLVEMGKIRPVIAAQFPLAEAAEAHRLMESSQHIGKIVLTTGH